MEFTPFMIVKPKYVWGDFYEITGLSGMKEQDLPKEYRDQIVYFFLSEDGNAIYVRNNKDKTMRCVIKVGDVIRCPEAHLMRDMLIRQNINLENAIMTRD